MIDPNCRMRSCCFVDDSKLPQNCDLRLVPDRTISTAVVPSVGQQYRLRLANTERSEDAVSTELMNCQTKLTLVSPSACEFQTWFLVLFHSAKTQQVKIWLAPGLEQAIFFHHVIGFEAEFHCHQSLSIKIRLHGYMEGHACWVRLFCSAYLSRMQLDRTWLRGRAHGPREPEFNWIERKHGLRTNVQPWHVVSLRNCGYFGHGWRYRDCAYLQSWLFVIRLLGTDRQPVADQRSVESRSGKSANSYSG